MDEYAMDTLQTNIVDTVLVGISDSVAPVVEEPVNSLFSNHLLQPESIEPITRFDPQNGLVFLLLGICAILIVYLQHTSDHIFSSIFKSSFDGSLAMQESRVDNSQRTRNIMLLQLISAISISIFASGVIFWKGETGLSFGPLFLYFFFGLITLIFLKRLLQWVLANLFQISGVLKTYHFNVNVLWSAAALLVFPLSVLLFFSPIIPMQYPMILGLGIFGFFYLKVLQRGVSIAINSTSVSPLHLFYYFCALEMLPVFVLIRLALEL
jgi:hypothetical protein